MTESEALRQHLEDRRLRRTEALDACEQAYAELREARRRYANAVLAAHTYGAGNSEIARRVGLSETSIRTFIKRRELND